MAEPILTESEPAVLIDPSGETGVFDDALAQRLEAALSGQAAPPAKSATDVEAAQSPKPAAAEPAKAEPAKTEPAKTESADAKGKPPALAPPIPRKAAEWDAAKKAAAEKAAAETSSKYEARIAELESKLKGPAYDSKTFETIKAERDDLAKRLQAVAIERHPEFQKEFTTNVNAAIAVAKKAVGDEHAEQIGKLLKQASSPARDQAIRELVEGLPAYKQAQVGTAIAKLDEIEAIRQQRIEESLANWEKLQAEAVATEHAKEQHRTQQAMTVFEDQVKSWTDPEKGRPVLQKRENDPEWNSKVDEAIEYAKNIVNGELEWDQMVDAALRGATHHLLLQDMAGLHSENESLRKELAALKGEQPGAGGSGATPQPVPGEPGVSTDDYGAALAELAAKQLGMR